jgi:hypothetical protein
VAPAATPRHDDAAPAATSVSTSFSTSSAVGTDYFLFEAGGLPSRNVEPATSVPNGHERNPTAWPLVGTARQPSEITGEAEPAVSHGVAEGGYARTRFGAPVVRSVPADPGPHERLVTIREVAADSLFAGPSSTGCANGMSLWRCGSAVRSGSHVATRSLPRKS